MSKPSVDRREFLRDLAGSAAAVAILPATARAQPARTGLPKLRFAVIGINHNHINSQVNAVLRGGGELVSVFAKEPDLLAGFTKTFPQAKPARSENEILEDSSIQLVLSSGIPVDRAPLGVRVMRHGKDYMADKPGIT